MARILYRHPSQTKHGYHVYTDLDFWDARRILGTLAAVRRNSGEQPSGDEFPTQVVGDDLEKGTTREIEKRLARAIVSPPRHVIVRSMVMEGWFEFDPLTYYPSRWSRKLMMQFTHHRLPLEQSSLCNPHQTVEISWNEGRIRVQRIQRDERHYPTIRTAEEAEQRLRVPSCF
jgi:hypothetical protein